MKVDDGWSLESCNWRKERLELVSAVVSAVAQSCVIILYIVMYAAAMMVVMMFV